MTQTRETVYSAIDSEREYQDRETSNPSRPDMIEDFRIADALGAIRFNLHAAEQEWYYDHGNYPITMDRLRKVAGLIVKMGEKYGMPLRS